MGDTWNKKEREKKKQKQKQDKAEKMQQRKESGKDGKSFESMIAYVDENGNFSSTPPDPRRKKEIKAEDIQIGVPQYEEPVPGEPRIGRVSFFNYDKGFGFIKDTETQESIFVHANNLSVTLKENDKVSFDTEKGQRGPVAINVKIIN
jgi:cold shock CspA family protein